MYETGVRWPSADRSIDDSFVATFNGCLNAHSPLSVIDARAEIEVWHRDWEKKPSSDIAWRANASPIWYCQIPLGGRMDA